MGLDAWVGSFSRVDDDVVDYMSRRFTWQAPENVGVFDLDTPMSDAVRSLCREVDTYSSGFDWDLFRSDYDIPEGWVQQVYRCSSEGIEVRYVPSLTDKSGDAAEASCDNWLLEHRYETVEPVRLLVAKWVEIESFRNDERVRAVAKRTHAVENCGYYDLDASQLVEILGESADCLCPLLRDGEVYAYHEWY